MDLLLRENNATAPFPPVCPLSKRGEPSYPVLPPSWSLPSLADRFGLKTENQNFCFHRNDYSNTVHCRAELHGMTGPCERRTCPSVLELLAFLPLLAAVQNPAASDAASLSKPAFLAQFEMFALPCSFCSPLTRFGGWRHVFHQVINSLQLLSQSI